MSRVDVVHVIKNISNIKRDDTHCPIEDLLIEMTVWATFNFSFVWWRGRAFNNTGNHILCQSLMPHVKCVILNRRDGLFVRITSKIEGCASFMKHVVVFIRLVKSNISHTVCEGWDLSGFTRS